tara:strand:+ start:449 stop:697 length:249 start_codon:yes stop_codon:yes gene_type:complete
MIRTGQWVIMRTDTRQYFVRSQVTALGTAHGWAEVPLHGKKFSSQSEAQAAARALPDCAGFAYCELIDFGDHIEAERQLTPA